MVGGGGLQDFSVSQGPLVLGLGLEGLGPGLDNLILRIFQERLGSKESEGLRLI